MWIFTPVPVRFIIIIKIINITHSAHVLLTLKTDTMYLCGIKSIVNMYRRRGGTKIEFYSEPDNRYVPYFFYEAR